MAITFTTTVLQDPGGSATGLPVPDEVVAALGKGRNPKVVVSLNGYTYRGTVQVSNARFMLSLSAEKRTAAGVHPGQQVEVTVELDTEPRTVEVPADLNTALAGKAGALKAFDSLSYSKRKEFVRQVEEAKAQETRDRRIAGIVAQLGNS
ncbi:MAG TPA: YdeI/OmpD-associated family protein [Chloroflexia bacterium]|nr:YdeI/OmpD-associated family protein [Chloroflexia bacterium]